MFNCFLISSLTLSQARERLNKLKAAKEKIVDDTKKMKTLLRDHFEDILEIMRVRENNFISLLEQQYSDLENEIQSRAKLNDEILEEFESSAAPLNWL